MGELVVRYVISVPKDYSPAKPAPFVLALHYGGSPNGAAQGLMLALVQPALGELGAVILAPESLGGGWDTPNNQRAVNALVEAVQASYRIDLKRMAVTGFSMGGTGTWSVVNRYPARFSAAIPVAGMPPASMGQWRTPVFAVHSRNDEVMPISPTEARIKELQKAGVRAELVVLTGISHHETNRFVDGLKRAVPWLKQTWQ
jgi:predicted peptidase